MPNKRSNIWQGIQLLRVRKRRHLTIHLHMDSPHWMHRILDNQHNLCNLLTEGNILDQ